MSKVRGLYGHSQRNFVISRWIIAGFCVAVCVGWILSSISLNVGFRKMFGEEMFHDMTVGGGVFTYSGGRKIDVGPNSTPECRKNYEMCKSVVIRQHSIWEIMLEGAQMGLKNIHIPILGVLAWLVVFWFQHGLLVHWATGASPASRSMEKRLYNIVENQSIQLGQPMPKLGIIESSSLNAFSSGLSPDDSTIVVTRGLMNTLTDHELEAVVAHEYTHILNGDSCVMLVAAVFVGVFENVFHHILSGITGAHEKQSIAWFLNLPVRIVVGIFIFGPVCISIALCWVPSLLGRARLSRSREYLADAGAVEITKEADALVAALLKIEHSQTVVLGPPTMQAMMIVGESGGVLSTHPTIAERIAALRTYAGARLPVKRVKLASASSARSGQQTPTFGRRVGPHAGR